MKPKPKANLSVLTILDVMDDPRFFGSTFRKESWNVWRVFLRALFALPMDAEQLALYQRYTGRTKPSPIPFTEAWICVGRRGGKSVIAALIVVYLAFFRDYAPYLAPGEIATVMVLAADRRQARTIMRYTRGFINEIPMLAAMMLGKPKRESIELTNRVAIEIHTAGTRTLRGYTCAAVMNDEIAFWNSDDSSEPAREILVAQRPSLSTIPGSILLSISTAGGKHGVFYESVTKNFGADDSSVLAWRATSQEMNSALDSKTVKAEYERDPVSAAAEYGSEFRSDLATFVSREAVEACVIHGRRELPRAKDLRYVAFCDPSGGSSDSMTLGVAHLTGRVRSSGPVLWIAVLDALREIRPPFSPDSAVEEFCDFLRTYGISEVCGDRYAGAWVSEQFEKHRILYRHSEKSRSEIYLEMLPLLNSGRTELLDEPRLFVQLCALERRISVSGKDSVDHPRGSHDDLANAAAGALVLASAGISQGIIHVSSGGRAIRENPRGWTSFGGRR